jgi:hypothetical protein
LETDGVNDELDLARLLVLEVAPEEAEIFGVMGDAYQRDPERFTKPDAGRDELLGFGIEAVAALMTPVVLAAVGAVVKYLITEVGNAIGVRAWLHRVLRRKGRPAEGGQSGVGQSAETEITLDATQLARVREIVLATCRQVGAPEDRSLLLANGVVGALSSGG